MPSDQPEQCRHAALLKNAIQNPLVVVILPGSPSIKAVADHAQDYLHTLQATQAAGSTVNGNVFGAALTQLYRQ